MSGNTEGRLLCRAPPSCRGATLRRTAARVVSWLAGHAPPWLRDEELPAQAFAGAAQLS